jgi:hypothetical protein
MLACLLRSVGHCRKPRRQGCLRSQEVYLDSFNAVFRENRANWRFALPVSAGVVHVVFDDALIE